MKVAVTGGLGFIGSHLVDRLVGKGIRTVAVDNFSTGRIENLGTSRTSSRLTVLNFDIRSPERLVEALAGVDAVVHAAALTSVQRSLEDPALTEDVNIKGTTNVLDACVAAGVKRFVFLSTAAVYGNARPPVKESAPSRPLSPYASSKVAGEKRCHEYSEAHGIETIVLRPFNVYGPKMAGGTYGGVMIKFAEAVHKGAPLTVYGDGEQTRDFVHVNDLVSALLLALESSKSVGKTFNVGFGVGTTINELACLFIGASGRRLKVVYGQPRKGEVRDSYADIGRARRQLGFRPKVALKKGVGDYLKWYGRTTS